MTTIVQTNSPTSADAPPTTQALTVTPVRRAAATRNWALISGLIMFGFVALIGVLGPLFWNTKLARVGSGAIILPPVWLEGGQAAHPLGTDASGRDMLALIIVGIPAALEVGFIAAGIGTALSIILGFTAGFMGGVVDLVIRTLADIAVTIPVLAVLIVLSVYVRVSSVELMAFLLAAFSWPGPTRVVRSQVLTMRERGYVRMARVSGSSTFDIMFREMLPNLLPYLAASLTGAVSGSILAATGLEALGLGPSRIPTLGTNIYNAINASALSRGLWWWWGFPILTLMLIFISLFLISLGLDVIANPRRKGNST